VAEQEKSARKVLSAARVARFNGWVLGISAVLSLLFALSSGMALVVGAGLAIVAWNELRGRKLLLRSDPRGPRLLGWNQLGLMGLLVAYCLWSIYAGLTGTNPELDALIKELEPMTGSIDDLQRTLTLVIYGGVIIGTIIFQGLNSLYYFTRTKHLQACLEA
jgi:membrane protease YdiL (CAAX protease family)